MLAVDGITKSFVGESVLNGVSWTLVPGKTYGLIGPSGGGKSVLMKIMGRVEQASGGSLLYKELKQDDIGLMFQEGALFDSMSVLDNVAFPLVGGTVPITTHPIKVREPVVAQVMEILRRVGLADAAAKYPAQLSGGMRRRASLARALVDRPSLVLLDDPTSGLDPVASSVIMELISELHEEISPSGDAAGGLQTTVMASHDLRRLFPAVDVIVALFGGKIVFEGTVEELLNSDNEALVEFVQCRYDLTAAAIH